MIIHNLYITSYTTTKPMQLHSDADILRCIFSIIIGKVERRTYRCIRLTCKRFRTAIDTLSVKPLVLASIGLTGEKHLPPAELDTEKLLQAPKHVLRTYFLTNPKHRLLAMRNKLYDRY